MATARIATALTALAVAAALAVTAVATLRESDPPPVRAAAGEVVVHRLALGERHVNLVLAPHRPGRNLVWMDTPDHRVGTDDASRTLRRRPGAPGGWAVVDLPAGPSTLWVQRGESRASVLLNAAPSAGGVGELSAADGPECLSAVIGAAVANASPPAACPAAALAATERAVLRAMVRSLVDRQVPGLRLVTGDSPRAKAAERTVRRTAQRLGLRVDGPPDPLDARMVVGGWQAAEDALLTQAEDPAGSGVYLAPWLGNGTLLGYSTGALVALNYDTTEGPAADYIAALDRFGVRALASPAGFSAWLRATGTAMPVAPTRLYAALAGFSLMGVDPHMHPMASATGGWIPNGRMAAVSGPLDTR